MTKDTRVLLKRSLKYDIIAGLILSSTICLFGRIDIASIYLFGIILASINFCTSGYILDKYLNISKASTIVKILLPFSYIARVFIIALVALIFINDLTYLLAYLCGFISHFPILAISYIRNRKEVV